MSQHREDDRTGAHAPRHARAARRRGNRSSRGQRRALAWAGWSLGGLVALVVLALGATAVDAFQVRSALTEAAETVPELEDLALAGDQEAIAVAVARLQDTVDDAASRTRRPYWTVSSWLPGVGPNVQAVREITGSLALLSDGPLASLPEVLSAVNPEALAPVDGRVDLAAIEKQAPVVRAAHQTVLEVQNRLTEVSLRGVVDQIASPLAQLRDQVAALEASSRTAARTVELLPAMLGSDGPRDYLALVQNNAEPRALGGIAGSVIVLRADQGAITLVEQRGGNAIGFPEPVGDLAPVDLATFGDRMGRYFVNVTATADFPRAAQRATTMWLQATGQEVSGVLSIDPVALAHLLGATGPVTTASGVELNEANAAQYLLNQIYLDQPDPQVQDAFFAEAAAVIFDAVASGQGDPGAAVRALATAAGEGRLMIWSADQTEQAELSGTALAGELRGDVGGAPVVGVFLNDGSGAKIGYYQDVVVGVDVLECRPDGSRRVSVALTLGSTVQNPEALSDYTTGGGTFVPEGDVRTVVLVYAPTGGAIGAVTNEGEDALVTRLQDEGLEVAAVTVTLEPGAAQSVTYEVEVAAGTPLPPVARVTPGPRNAEVVVTEGC